MPGVLLGLAIAAHALALLRQPLESPRDVVFSILFQVQAWAAAMLAVGLGLVVVRSWRARVTLARLASDLGEAPAPGSLGPVLARATATPVSLWCIRCQGRDDMWTLRERQWTSRRRV